VHLGIEGGAHAIIARAAAVDADLILVGTHGRGGLAHLFLGSVAERVVRSAPCSVFVARGAADLPKRIVVGIDLSEAASAVLAAASEIARRTGAELALVHALEISVPFVNAYQISEPNAVVTAAFESASRQLAEFAASCDTGSKVTTEVVSEPPAVALAGAAASRSADLVVVGSRGLTGLRHALLGSVAERTLRHAPCSVWVVRSRVE
jgi:nucleotide-binding universal stress UspA family protein